MESGLTEQLRHVGVGELLSFQQQKAETLGFIDTCGLQQEAVEPSPPERQQEANETPCVVPHSLPNVVDRQCRAGEIRTSDLHFLRSMLDAQRDKIHEQLQELQKVVVQQCRITGTNPLAQEMAAVVLGKRVGKKFGDSLTPKALKCLYNVFSIKDTITKKEAREISALCGATVTQVREFFAGQRSRVRKVVHSSHIDHGSDDPCLRVQSIHLDQSALVGLQIGEKTLSSLSQQVASNQCNHLVLLEMFCGKPDGISSKLYAVEKAEHLINVMHKETTFTGQSQLAQVVMQAHDSVLRCFMARGGLQQIIRWLIQAAAEEQTSLIRLILKAIAQLPLGSASPRHMSLLLQTVNKLRFYRAQDVASRARLLLSRWSRFCKSTQSGKPVSSTGIARTSQPGLKRSRDCTPSSTVDDASKKKAKAGTVAVNTGQTSDVVSSSLIEDKTVHERPKPETATEITNTRKRLGSFLIQGDRAKEKRKVQLFEETRAAIRRRDGEGTKSSSFEPSSRPLSADDIKKAKRRAYFLNNAKAEKPSSSKLEGSMTFERGQKMIAGNFGHHAVLQDVSSKEIGLNSVCSSMEKGRLEPALKHEVDLKVSDVLQRQHAGTISAMEAKYSIKSVQSSHVQSNGPAEAQILPESESSSLEFVMGVGQSETCGDENAMDLMPRIQWTKPPRLALDPRWKVASGEQSTEIGSETKRLSTVLEASYLSPQCIPSNPAEPAERICLFVDDILVPEILLEAVDEESLERDCSLQSPRDLEPAEVRIGQADSQKAGTNPNVKVQEDVSCSGMMGIPGPVGLEVVTENVQLSSTKDDQQLSLMTLTAQLDGNKPVLKINSAIDAMKSACGSPSELMVAQAVDQACVEVRKTHILNAEAHEQGYNTPFFQPRIKEANSVFKDQTLAASPATIKASQAAPFQSLVVREDISSSVQRDRDSLRETTSSATNMEMPSLRDQIVNPSSRNNSSGVDLSELSKETCLDMLNIVLQQLADNAKGSGADLELLSVFLKNPQLVYSLMSSQVESLGKGLPAAFTGRDLGEIISSSTMGSLGKELEELVGRNIGQVANSVIELANAGSYTSEIGQPAGPQSHPLLPASIPRPPAAIESAIQLPNSQSRLLEGNQFLKHPAIQEVSCSRSSDYDWSQPYDYSSGCMQQGTGSARHPVHTSITINRSRSNSAHSQNAAGYPYSHLARASQSQSSVLQTDQRVQSSMPMYGGGHGQLSQSMVHAERQERATNRRNGFYVVDAPTTRLLPNSHARGAGISDGLLPVPDVAANNHRVHPCKVMHEPHLIHGRAMPVFSPEIRVNHAAIGHQMPHHLNNGPYYCDQSFGPQSLSSSRPPYVSHGRGPSSFIPSPARSQGNPNLWRSPPSHFNHPRNGSPRWREG